MIETLILNCNRFLIVFLLTFFLLNGLSYRIYSQSESDVINNWLHYSDASNSLYRHLAFEAFQLLESRKEKISQLKTPDDWHQRQLEVKKAIWDVVGPFPDKTPLNAKTTGKVKKPGYTIENIIYESLPNFFVTASLFIPDGIKKPVPAILFCSGHSALAYRRDVYQLPLLNLVKKGFVVLAIDPLGQGERVQYLDLETNTSIIGSSTKEHSYPSPQVALLGQSVARYFIWDGIRGIDYLVSRKEVDPKRIGVHGLSGGGTQTAYISALDDRVVASAPACYITSYRRLMESIGPQDGEQNFYHGISKGIDHADFIQARAPKPTLVMATTRDFFSIQGVRESMAEIQWAYDAFGQPGNIELVEDDHGHGYTQKTREAMYAFFQKHLMLPGSPDEEEIEYLTEEELQKTSTGQLASSLGGDTVFELNLREYDNGLSQKLQDLRKDLPNHLSQVIMSAKQLSGYKEPSIDDEPVLVGMIQKDGHAIEKYFLKGEGNYVIPYLMFVPEKPNNKAIVYLHPQGKTGVMENGNFLEWLIDKGYSVLVPDLVGIGELGNGVLKGDAYIQNISYNVWFSAKLIGRSILGIQAADLIKLSHTLKNRHNFIEVYGIARAEMSPILLHAAALDQVISRVALIKPYSSYRSFVVNRFYNPNFTYSIVPGALTAYDLPDLAAALAPAKLLVAGITDANALQVDMNKSDMVEVIKKSYQYKNADEQYEFFPVESIEKPDDLFAQWLR